MCYQCISSRYMCHVRLPPIFPLPLLLLLLLLLFIVDLEVLTNTIDNMFLYLNL